MKVSIVIPAYNEKDNLPPLMEDITEKVRVSDYEIIVVDDHSSDDTPKICEKLKEKYPNLTVIRRKKGKNGMGYALMDGSKKAVGEYIFWVMGDRSDKLESINEMVEKLDGGLDIVMASRYMPGGSRGELEVDKAVYGSTYTRLAKIFFGIPVHDITNAYRGFRKEILDKLDIKSGDFAISPEFAIKSAIKGYKMGEVPTTYFNRRAGVTKFNILKMGLRYLSLFRLKFTYPKSNTPP